MVFLKVFGRCCCCCCCCFVVFVVVFYGVMYSCFMFVFSSIFCDVYVDGNYCFYFFLHVVFLELWMFLNVLW